MPGRNHPAILAAMREYQEATSPVYPEHLHSWEVTTDHLQVKLDLFFIAGKQYVPTRMSKLEALALAAELHLVASQMPNEA